MDFSLLKVARIIQRIHPSILYMYLCVCRYLYIYNFFLNSLRISYLGERVSYSEISILHFLKTKIFSYIIIVQ